MQRFVAQLGIMNGMGKYIRWVLFIGLLILVGRFLFLVWIGSPTVGTTKEITLQEGTNVATVAVVLQESHIIPRGIWYRVYGLFSSNARHPKPGVYHVQPGERFSALSALFALGPQREEVRVQVIEGWSIRDIRQMLIREFNLKEADITRLMGKEADLASFDAVLRTQFSFLKTLPVGRGLEGYLFPDTYRVWKTQLPEAFVLKQLQEFQDRIASRSVTSASAPLKTLDQVVILASIVEKEVATKEERRMVAGIFLRRLKEGIPLQSDATVNYITQSGRDRSTAEDLQTESLYNTYKHKGLPPGPISNPSEDALVAVFEPTPSPYRYFLTDTKGNIYYASTLEQHAANRRKAGY